MLRTRATSIRQLNSVIIRAQRQNRLSQKQLSSNSKNATEETTANKTAESYGDPNMDPHQVSDSMIRNARTDIRISGTEALNDIHPETHYKNYAMALSLMGFVTGVWYYSISSVGKAEGGMEELMADAELAKKDRVLKSQSERSAEELAQLDVTMSEFDGDDDIVVAVAADDEIAQREEDLNMSAGKKAKSGKPLWKKVVFFWRRD
jgi:hypothetical protein